MSTSRERRPDGGFTLVEVLISMVLLMLVMAAVLPALLATMKSGTSARKQLQGKNLSQERIEQMRDLRFHVDRQNGPFLDLLDIYYTNATSASPQTTLTVGAETLVGRYVASAAAAGGAPAGPYYKVSIANISGHAGFSETVYAQFLSPSGAVIPASRFQDSYDSQTAGRDAPPASLMGVTVITTWTDAGVSKSLRTYTRMTDGKASLPTIQTQARAVAVDISSTAADGSTLELQAGLSSVDGAQSNGSSVAGYAAGAVASRTGASTVTGLTSRFDLPGTGATSSGSSSPQSGSGCSWYGFGQTATANVGGDVSAGLPKSPTNVDSTTPPSTMSGFIRSNGGGSCGQLSYDNLAGGGASRIAWDAIGAAMGPAPFVGAADVTSGNSPSIVGETYVSSNALTASPQKSIAGAKASALQPIVLFPGYAASSGRGLVSVRLVSAKVDCTSATTAGALGTTSGSYQLELGWWGKGPGDTTAVWHTATYSYNSATASTVSVTGATWNPTQTDIGSGLKLSDVVTGPGPTGPTAVLDTGATTGLRGFTGGIMTLTTASTLTNEVATGYSALRVRIGQLTCVADDQR